MAVTIPVLSLVFIPRPNGFILLALPAAVTVGIMVSVVFVMRREGGVVMAVSALLSIVAATLALTTYGAMARGAYATFAGYYLTAIAGLFALIQRASARSKHE